MTRQNIRSTEKELFADDVGRSNLPVIEIMASLGKAAAKRAGRSIYREITGRNPEENPVYRAGQRAVGFGKYARERMDSGESLGDVLTDEVVGAAKSYGNTTLKRLRARYAPFDSDSTISSAYTGSFFDNYVRGFLNGKTYGATVSEAPVDTFLDDEYTENGQQKKGSLGMWKYEGGRKVVYIPRTEDLGTLIGKELSEKQARAVQTYIKGHEILEANPLTGPASSKEHAAFEGAYLASLERLAKFDDRAREAYRGARIVYMQRAANKREFLDEVSEHFPVEELAA